jgi:hypothetical protein
LFVLIRVTCILVYCICLSFSPVTLSGETPPRLYSFVLPVYLCTASASHFPPVTLSGETPQLHPPSLNNFYTSRQKVKIIFITLMMNLNQHYLRGLVRPVAQYW